MEKMCSVVQQQSFLKTKNNAIQVIKLTNICHIFKTICEHFLIFINILFCWFWGEKVNQQEGVVGNRGMENKFLLLHKPPPVAG